MFHGVIGQDGDWEVGLVDWMIRENVDILSRSCLTILNYCAYVNRNLLLKMNIVHYSVFKSKGK